MKKEPVIKDNTGFLDRKLSDLILHTLPFWHDIGFTPNGLTTLGFISSIMFFVYFNKSNLLLTLVFLVLRWYFDYADGMLARKYKLTSKFGDYYDHITDWIFYFGFIYSIYIKSNMKSIHILILLISTFIFGMHQGCIEKANHKYNKSETSLSWLRHLCINSKFVYLFDNTVLYLVFIFLICHILK